MFHKCKATVVQRGVNRDLADAYLKKPENCSACTRVADHQEFIISNPFEMPQGICPWAWADIRPFILTIASGGSLGMMKNRHTALATCSDLFRPVTFKIEKMDE